MKLTQLASKPQLTKITIEDENIVEKYGEAIEYWIYDRTDMDTFMKLASLEGKSSLDKIVTVMQDLILDEEGNKILDDGKVLPTDVMIKAVEETIKNLGNQKPLTTMT